MSDLINRLSHLVNYSSQLIFVSGESAADQQRCLSDFLASQQENTEISFLNATDDQGSIEYRSAICRQLGEHTVGSFVRPLQQLLQFSQSNPETGLRAANGPYLVCITQAEKLSDSFLQELWDWVMHSQVGDEKIHVNIILFGESSWAKRAQHYLPSQNSHKPVLLSSESVNPVGFDVNALEALMADKGSWLSASNKPTVSNKWFIIGVMSLFLFTFLGLMSWQYPHLIESLSQTPSVAQNPQRLPKEQIPEQIQNLEKTSVDATPITTDYASNLEIVKDNNAESVTDEMLVTSWGNKFLAPLSVESSLNTEQPQIEPAPTERTSKAIALSEVVASDMDFQVPDIISVEQLSEQLAKQEELNLDKQKNIIAADPAPNTNETQSTIDYQFDETTLLALPSDAIVLQLSGIQNPIVLENYLNSNNLQSSTWVYQTQRYGGPWYVVIYNEVFASIDAALQQKPNLPIELKETQAFAKSIDQVQDEISRR